MVEAVEEKPIVSDRWIEKAKCQASLFYFLKYVRVDEEGQGAIPFERWQHIDDSASLILDNKYSVILKARQVGITWLLAALAVWYLYFRPSSLVLVTSQNEDKAGKFLDKVKFIHRNLPKWMQMKPGAYGTQKITFPAMGSEIDALPSTDTASIGEHASLVIMDEADFHEYATKYFNLGKPTIDKGESKMVLASTVNPERQDTLFKSICRKALGSKGQFKFMFIPYDVLPYRDAEWLEKACDNEYGEAGMTKELYKATQYPSDAQEALSPPSAIAAFDHVKLTAMRVDLIKPEVIGPIRIFRPFVVGHTYAAFSDTSEGTGRDESVTVVLDKNTGIVVARIKDSSLGPEDLAYYSYQMLERYHFPLWGIESNKRGYAAVNKAVEMKYPNLFYQDWQGEYKRDESKKSKPGWNSGPSEGNSRHRSILWDEGIYAVATDQIKILDEEGLTDFFSVIRNPNKGGRVEGLSGTHDDYPFTVCGAWQMLKFTQNPIRGPSKPISFI